MSVHRIRADLRLLRDPGTVELLDELEQQIADLENRITALDDVLAQGGDDWERLQQDAEEKQRTEAALEAALAEWEDLGTELES